MVTITDVAKEAGVSPSTVSRAINNSMLVSQEKKDRVMAAVKKLGYKQIRLTDARKAQQTKIIILATAMLLEDMIDAVRHEAEMLGYSLILLYVGEAYEGYKDLLNLLKIIPEHLVGGLILVHNDCQDAEVWAELSTYPNVQIGESLPSSPFTSISVDDCRAASEMTSYLIESGHKRIAFVKSPANRKHEFTEKRYQGYRKALEEAGLEAEDRYCFEVDHTLEGGADAAKWLMELDHRPDAVFCTTDHVAVGCIVELAKRGIQVPKDIAVSGFDNFEVSEICTPSLTTIAQPFDEMGIEALHMLDRLISGTIVTGRRVYASHTLVKRDSV